MKTKKAFQFNEATKYKLKINLTSKAKMNTFYTYNNRTDLNININFFYKLCRSNPQLYVE